MVIVGLVVAILTASIVIVLTIMKKFDNKKHYNDIEKHSNDIENLHPKISENESRICNIQKHIDEENKTKGTLVHKRG